MNKEILKSVFGGMKINDSFTINFISQFAMMNGDYKISKMGTGRGKGGSIVVEAINTVSGNKLTSLEYGGKPHLFGTSVSDNILNITVNGKMFGVKHESDLPKTFARDKEAGDQLRDALKPFLTKKTPTVLKIASSQAPEFNGTWNISNIKLNPGRHGQISLMLTNINDPSDTRELWSFRHSTIIDSLETVD
jgi:hypothetical protein